MATPPEADEEEAPHRPSMTRRVGFFAFGALVPIAAMFYVWWGLAYGRWLDNGVYAVTIVLLLFGLSGMWLMIPERPVVPAPAP